MFKDFWYMFFWTEVKGKRKYFLNYNRCRKYYYSQDNVSKSYCGLHISGRNDRMHNVVMFETRSAEEKIKACGYIYDRWSSGGNDNMIINGGIVYSIDTSADAET